MMKMNNKNLKHKDIQRIGVEKMEQQKEELGRWDYLDLLTLVLERKKFLYRELKPIPDYVWELDGWNRIEKILVRKLCEVGKNE